MLNKFGTKTWNSLAHDTFVMVHCNITINIPKTVSKSPPQYDMSSINQMSRILGKLGLRNVRTRIAFAVSRSWSGMTLSAFTQFSLDVTSYKLKIPNKSKESSMINQCRLHRLIQDDTLRTCMKPCFPKQGSNYNLL